MGARSKQARKIREASEFDAVRLRTAIAPPPHGPSVYAWSLPEIFNARNAQMLGQFALAARLSESMRTDDALAVAYENRLDPQRCIKVEMKSAKGARGAPICSEADALFGQNGIGILPETISDIHGCLVNHGVAFGLNQVVTRDDGSRVDFFLRAWPIEFVRWDPVYRTFMARVDPQLLSVEELKSLGEAEPPNGYPGLPWPVTFGCEIPIVHGDGRWVVFAKNELEPFKHGALLPAALVWARHAFACRDWAKSSVAHGSAKVIGELAQGVPLQGADGKLTPEAQAFIELLRDYASSDAPVGIRPAGSKTDFVTNTSTAWQIFENLVQNAEKAAARIYLGTDGVLGSNGGAPGVDIQALFGVSRTRVEGDLKCIERGIDTGTVEPWTAMNFGDSSLAPKRRYMLADADADAARASMATRKTAFYDELDRARAAGVDITQDYVNRIAKEHGVEAPALKVTPPATQAAAPVPVRAA